MMRAKLIILSIVTASILYLAGPLIAGFFLSLSKPYVRHQFEITPKAFANFSPRLKRSDNLGIRSQNSHSTLKRVRQLPNPFRVGRDFEFFPRVLANARTLG